MEPVRSGIWPEAAKKLSGGSETQPLATLVDLSLPGAAALESRLRERVLRFAAAWLRPPGCPLGQLLLNWQVDNFGLQGTALLMGKMGVRTPVAELERRGLARMALEERSREAGQRERRFFYKDRVYCYCEFALQPAGSAEMSGILVKEYSFLGTRAGKSGLLWSTVLPINELVDRSLCAEFQALSELCDRLDDVGRRQVTGHVSLLTTGASCLSCVNAFRQFLSLFPGVALGVRCVKRPDWGASAVAARRGAV